MRFVLAVVGGLLALGLGGMAPAHAQARVAPDAFVGYDAARGLVISPSGRYIALIRREAVGDVLVVLDRETRALRPIQRAIAGAAENGMQIDFVEFKSDERIVFSYSYRVPVTEQAGSANRTRRRQQATFIRVSHVRSSGVDGSSPIVLYDPQDQNIPRYAQADIVSLLPNDPDHVLLLTPLSQVWRVNVNTGEHTTVEDRAGNAIGYIVDSTGTPVLRQDVLGFGRGFVWYRRGPGQSQWTEIARFRGASGANSGPTFEGVGPALQPGHVFVLARREGQDTSGLYVYDTATGQYVETVQQNPEFDISNAIRDLENNRILAACWWAYRWTCNPQDPDFGVLWERLNRTMGENVNVRLISRAREDGSLWLIETSGPQDLGTFHLYDTTADRVSRLVQSRPSIQAAQLPTKRVVRYTASDGMQLWGYLWLPPGVTDARNLPLIVVPHGGPEGRDIWGFDPFATSFSSQGYAVFQPNFRGGGGFGRRFVEAGHRQWGQRMQQDVADGTRHLIQAGIADANRICIAGWSYGGYVAFTATVENADLFKCSMAGAGVSDLIEMLDWVRFGDDDELISGGGGGVQSIAYQYWTEAIGEPGRDRAMLERYSAARNADRVAIPLLIIHGDRDRTVPVEQSEIMEQAMRRAGKPVRFVRLEDTDHYFTPDQGAAWRTVMTESLAFFNQHIGPGVPPPQP
ncbi:MAG: alpha/beta fold hydrolase [Hyphomonadaceae bacterium]|nr:alpha/beta fold hydrolase [Hyphomonadaceae bacterium]